MSSTPTTRLLLLVGAFAIAAAFVLAGCGTASSAAAAKTATTTTTAPTAASRRAALAAYRTCMSQHGVTLPTRTPGTGSAPAGGGGGGFGGGGFGGGGGAFGGTPSSLPAGVTQAQYSAAQSACRSKLPTGGFGRTPADRQALAAYTSCMKDHGIVLPARFGRGAGSGSSTTTAPATPTTTIDRTSPAFQAAQKVCAALLPAGGAGGPGGPGAGGSTTTTVAG